MSKIKLVVKFNNEKIKKDFSEKKIQAYAKEKELSEVGALAYIFITMLALRQTCKEKTAGARCMLHSRKD